MARAGWRFAAGAAVGVLVAVVLSPSVRWQAAVLGGWDAAAVSFLAGVWPAMVRADGARTAELAQREDLSRDTARLLLLVSCGASVTAVGLALGLARDETGGERAALVAISILTVVLSWTVVNTVFTLRYADLFYRWGGGLEIGGPGGAEPEYRDFAYVAFTIGMTYQVSDTTLRDRRVRRTVLVHALVSYVFGVVIVAAGVNVVSGLVG